jgi:hypothetical protein
MKLILLCFFISLYAQAQEFNDSFIITLFPDKITVIGPRQALPIASVIIDNRSLSDFRAKISSESKNLVFFSVPSQSKIVQTIEFKSERIKFIPLSPALEEIELVFGKKAYEIP